MSTLETPVASLPGVSLSLALPWSIQSWNLPTLREKLVKIGAKVATHSRYVIFQVAEIAVPRKLFAR